MTELKECGNLRIRDHGTTVLGLDEKPIRDATGRLVVNYLPRGKIIPIHFHHFDHMAYIIAGSFLYREYREGNSPGSQGPMIEERMVYYPDWFNVAKRHLHSFEVVEPGIIHCVFSYSGGDKDSSRAS